MHMEQLKNIVAMVKAISDGFDADRRMAGVAKFKAVCDFSNVARKVVPEYQQLAIQACCFELMRQMNQ